MFPILIVVGVLLAGFLFTAYIVQDSKSNKKKVPQIKPYKNELIDFGDNSEYDIKDEEIDVPPIKVTLTSFRKKKEYYTDRVGYMNDGLDSNTDLTKPMESIGMTRYMGVKPVSKKSMLEVDSSIRYENWLKGNKSTIKNPFLTENNIPHITVIEYQIECEEIEKSEKNDNSNLNLNSISTSSNYENPAGSMEEHFDVKEFPEWWWNVNKKPSDDLKKESEKEGELKDDLSEEELIEAMKKEKTKPNLSDLSQDELRKQVLDSVITPVPIPGKKWTIWHRYSDFYTLHEELVNQFGTTLTLPPFAPRKPMLTDKNDDQFLNERKNQLESYLNQLLRNQNIRKSRFLQKFLNTRNRVEEEKNQYVEQYKSFDNAKKILEDPNRFESS